MFRLYREALNVPSVFKRCEGPFWRPSPVKYHQYWKVFHFLPIPEETAHCEETYGRKGQGASSAVPLAGEEARNPSPDVNPGRALALEDRSVIPYRLVRTHMRGGP